MAADDGPLLLLVDDAHWADAESLRLLERVVRAAAAGRILLVASVLSGEPPEQRPPVRDLLSLARSEVTPGCLTPEGARTLAEAHLGAPADEEFVRACHLRTGGNPLFLTALLTEAAFHGLKPAARHAPDVAALRPAMLRQRLLVLLNTLPEHVRATAFALTVLDRHAEPALLDGLVGMDAVRRAEALRVLGLTGLVTGERRPVFAHPVVRDAVEDCLPSAERAGLRIRAAEQLHRAGHPVEEAAEHLMNVTTPPGGSAEALQILRTAADGALRRGAPRDAARFLRRALLECSSTGPDRARLLVDLATVERSFAVAVSVRHVVEAVPLLDGARERAAAVTRLGPVLMAPVAFPVDDMVRRVSADLAASGSTHRVDRELALRLEARERFLSSQDPVRARASLHRLRELGAEPPLDTVGERELLTVLLHMATAAGSVPAAEAATLATGLLEHEPPSPTHVHTALPLLVNTLVAADRTEGIGAWLREAHGIARSRAGEVEAAVIRAEQALVALAEGDLTGAREKALEADGPAGAELSGFPAVCVAVLALVALRTGEPERAERILLRYRLGAENQYLAALLAAARGGVAVRSGDVRGGLEHFLMAGHRLEQTGWHNPAVLPWASAAVVLHDRLGQTAAAAELSRREVDRARAWGAPTALGRALTARGRVTPGRPGERALEEAVAVLESGADRYELCLALCALGSRLGSGAPRGRAALRRALDLSAECGAVRLHSRVRGRLGRGAAPGPGPRRDAVPLTPAELRVARLAATGLSNQDITVRLSVSLRTVEKHLTNSYRKLGIRGRDSLPAALPPGDAAPPGSTPTGGALPAGTVSGDEP
jgi:DNA-binding CsgD family transcriptional regulator